MRDRTLHALIGPNGAGKTTAFNLLSGMFPPDAGTSPLAGRRSPGLRPKTSHAAGIGRSFQITNLFAGLSVEENMRLAVQARIRSASTWSASRRRSTDVNAETDGVHQLSRPYRHRAGRGGSLSYGGQRLLDMGLALATAPRILLLDEPLAGLAAAERERVAALIKRISRTCPCCWSSTTSTACSRSPIVVTVMNEGARAGGRQRRGRAQQRQGAGGLHRLRRGALSPRKPARTAASAGTLLAVDKVDTFYGKSHILNAVSFDVPENEIVALLGRNGAGKSTLLKTLIGIAPPRDGSIKLAGDEIAGLPSGRDRASRHRLRAAGPGPVRRHDALRQTSSSAASSGKPAGACIGTTSASSSSSRASRSGWTRRLIIFPAASSRWSRWRARLSGDVRVLLLDEPFEGLSPAIIEELFEAFDRLRHEIAIVIVDHHLDLALALSDRTVILERGSVSWTGASKLLREDLQLRRQKLWM